MLTHTADIPTLNLVQYAQAIGGITDADVLGHIHAGLRSAPQTKTHRRFMETKLLDLQAKRDATRAAYEQAVAEGKIRCPAPPTLEERASGHPDNPSVQAALRLLEKKKARQEAQF